jgi:hypothetical protein
MQMRWENEWGGGKLTAGGCSDQFDQSGVYKSLQSLLQRFSAKGGQSKPRALESDGCHDLPFKSGLVAGSEKRRLILHLKRGWKKRG